ncbi:Zinc finger BED domain-containing protein RICESLEEPER 3, partial [Bienertia sinuspersici]
MNLRRMGTKIIHDVLKTFDNATHIFSYVYELNIYMGILECIIITHSIKQISEANPDPSVKNVLLLFLIHVTNSKKDYGAVIQPDPVESSKGESRFWFLGPVLEKQQINPSSSSSPNVGIDEYLSYQFETKEDFHIIQWWKNHSLKFPILARIAKDILEIPASTFAYESSFSVCKTVLDEKRPRCAPQSIKMC